MFKKIILGAFTITALFSFSACNKLDVIGDKSIESFDTILNAIPDKVTEDENYGGWSLNAPDDSARFIWSKDYNKSTGYDALIEIDAQPFINAGLDVSKLPEGMYINDKLIVGTDFGDDSLSYKGDITPIESYKQIVKLNRKSIKYLAALDHYGVELDNGNMFEWAKDKSKNDKDIVFVLNPQVLIDAGVTPENVEGWLFAKVETMDMDGKMVEVDKFLKPFELDNQQ